LLINMVSVWQQEAPATGHPTPTVGGDQIHVTQDGPRDVTALALINTGPSRDAFIPQGPTAANQAADDYLLQRSRSRSAAAARTNPGIPLRVAAST
jgi:hypothetical protein